jgi:hypothetical protein
MYLTSVLGQTSHASSILDRKQWCDIRQISPRACGRSTADCLFLTVTDGTWKWDHQMIKFEQVGSVLSSQEEVGIINGLYCQNLTDLFTWNLTTSILPCP